MKKQPQHTQIYTIIYDRKIGGTNTIYVKARTAAEAIANAKNTTHTGKNFRHAN